MKKYITILLLLLTFSCVDLEEVDPARYTEANFLDLYENGHVALVNSAYVTLNDLVFGPNEGGPLLYFDEGRGDDLIRQQEFRDDALHSYILFNYTQDDSKVEKAWEWLYEGIFRANYAINALLEVEKNAQTDKLIGEAYFLRGFYYFTLARWFGAAPIVKNASSIDFYPKSSPENEVWQQAETDMLESLKFLGDDLPPAGYLEGRINKAVALGVLARLHLYQARPGDGSSHWQKVIDYCQQVKDLNYFKLETEFADIFDITRFYNNETNEFIFPVTFAYGEDNNGNTAPGNYYNRITRILSPYSASKRFYLTYFTDPTTGQDVLGRENRGAVAMSDGVYNLFEQSRLLGDKRYDASVLYPTFTSYKIVDGVAVPETIDMVAFGIEPCINKYQATGLKYAHRSLNAPHPWSILRYADILLMQAEAQNEVNNGPTSQAYQNINEVRDRAGLEPLSGLGFESFRQAVWDERRLEFLFEGLRVPDLIRTNRYEIGKFTPPDPGANVFQEKFSVIPIPSRELRVNKNLVQHELWR